MTFRSRCLDQSPGGAVDGLDVKRVQGASVAANGPHRWHHSLHATTRGLWSQDRQSVHGRASTCGA